MKACSRPRWSAAFADSREVHTGTVARTESGSVTCVTWTSATPPRKRPSARTCATGSPETSRRTGRPGRRRSAVTATRRRARWSRKLYDGGYVGLTWPKEYGGGGLPHTLQGIFLEEQARVGAPQHIGVIGLGMAGPTIIAHGTEEQKSRYLEPLLKADEIWCQGFSEPGSGSDLAGARTRAVLDGDEWVVNGQKVWSSYAHIADFCILVVRTDPDAEKHSGLSYLLVDMKSPGVEVRPLTQITGDPEFNEIFFTDVRVPADLDPGQAGRWLAGRDDHAAARARHARASR